MVLPKVVTALEEPIADPAALCSYLISEAARGQVKVLISGLGADELFGGYPVVQAGRLADHLFHVPEPLTHAALRLAQALPYAPFGHPWQWLHRLRKILYSGPQPWPERFCLLRSPLRTPDLASVLHPSLFPVQKQPFGRHRKLGVEMSGHGLGDYERMLALDAATYLPGVNLAYSDKTSMAHSIELRVPYLGRGVLDLALRMPAEFKLNLRETKIALKAVAQSTLPSFILRRPKAGFGIPLRDWMAGELLPLAQDLLSPARLQRQGYFQPKVPARWLAEHSARKADHGMRLYSLMIFQLWHDRFLA